MTTKTPPPTPSPRATTRRIGSWDAVWCTIRLADGPIGLWQVDGLERHVDRAALLGAGVDPPEPPYWALLWSGARVLAEAVPMNAGRVLEIGCGLGLPGLVAARRGARVTCVDRARDALAFVRASAAANALAVHAVAMDAAAPALRARFDTILAAEVLYDRAAFPALAAVLRARLAPGGRILLADAGRIDTRAFYDGLPAAGLLGRATEHRVREEGWPLVVRLAELGRVEDR